VIMYCFNFSSSWKIFIPSSLLNDSFAVKSILDWNYLLLIFFLPLWYFCCCNCCAGWGYIVTFTKVLTMCIIYHTWNHPLQHSPHPFLLPFLEEF
jgi:hypothetical protein